MKSEALAQALVTFTSREDIDAANMPSIRSHLCLVLDVSGSMNDPVKYPLLRQAIPILIDALQDDDHLTIVLFAQGYDVALASEPVGCCRTQMDDIIHRIDKSGVMFGRMTRMAPGLRAALDEIQHFRTRMPMAVNRLYILSDGELHDSEECYQLNPRLRTLEVELNSYGFGKNWAQETMKRIMEGVPGGTVKPIFNTQDVKATFGHLGELAENIVAQEAEFSFTFASDVMAGDAFRYKPGTHYFGSVDRRHKTFTAAVGALERDRIYTFLLEGRLRPSPLSQQEIGKAILRFRQGDRWQEIERPVLVSRTEEEWRIQHPNDQALEAYCVLDAMRRNDPEAQLEALRARRAIYQREGADPELFLLVERAIGKLVRGEALTEDDHRGLAADKQTVSSNS